MNAIPCANVDLMKFPGKGICWRCLSVILTALDKVSRIYHFVHQRCSVVLSRRY